jgi:ubiquinone/menaquinone biosynthesis C-methylase UbiE
MFYHENFAGQAEECLADLGLTFSDLEGKKTLDVGAGHCTIGYVAEKWGMDVTSVDNGLHDDEWGYASFQYVVPYLKADAKRLPFADNTFDLALSRFGPPLMYFETIKEIREGFEEVLRVLKPGGAFRFTPDSLHGKYCVGTRMPIAEKCRIVERDVMRFMFPVRRKSRALLREWFPNVELPFPTEQAQSGYGVLRKP